MTFFGQIGAHFSRGNALRFLIMGAVALVLGSVSSLTTAQDLIFVMDPPSAESNRFWAAGSDFTFPPLQSLVGNDPVTGVYDNSGLAESWEANDDFTVWTFRLHPAAEFHFGWGPVTTADVVHSYGYHTGSESLLTNLELILADELEIIDDQTIAFHLADSRPNYPFAHAGRGSLYIYSKAQFDAEGLAGYDRRPAGSGQLQFVARNVGQNVVFERVQNHWSGEDAAFETLELRFVSEAATKLALLLANEADLVALPRELQGEALSAGFGIQSSSQPSMQTTYIFGSLYYMPGDEYETEMPWHDVRIREALNRAVDREAAFDILYEGRAEPLAVFGMDPRGEGYTPELEARFEEMYGYDPDRARELMAEAGYPDAFDDPTIPVLATFIAGNPEFPTAAELMQSFFADVGFQTRLVEFDWAGLNAIRRARTVALLFPMRNAPIRPTEVGLTSFYSVRGGPANYWEHPDSEALLAQYFGNLDTAERDRLASEIFTYQFENYATIPLATVTTDVAYNPATVSGWTFPGVTSAGYSHFHLIRPAQ